MNLFGLLFVAAGVFSIVGAVADWDWYMNSRKARLMVMLLSRNGARIFYVLLGTGICLLGMMVLLGVIDMSK